MRFCPDKSRVEIGIWRVRGRLLRPTHLLRYACVMKGFLIIDKHQGVTSFDMVARARRILDVRKIGHLGTLDPLATGVLVLAVGEATKLIEYLMGADKEYEATLEFGKTSDTYDLEGTITETGAPIPTPDKVEAALNQFCGEILQIPPAFSALKINGRPAYALAREGKTPDLKPRPVYIEKLELVSFEGAIARLEIVCSSGTYIRSLVHDLGRALNVGAIMTGLRRPRVGQFTLKGATEIAAQNLISIEKVVANWSTVRITENEMFLLRQGKKIPSAGKDSIEPMAVFCNDKLVSLAKSENGFLRPIKNFVVE